MPQAIRVIDRVRDQSDFSGSLSDGQFLKYDLATDSFKLAAVSSPSGANPTATVSGSAINGSAATFMRSDAAPALANTTVAAGSYTYASITVDAQGRLTAASSGSAVPVGANPTASVGLAAVNGSAGTFLRSDGAPALSQAIAPTWTGLHTFQAQTSAKAAVFKAAATTPDNIVEWQSSGGGALGAFGSGGGIYLSAGVAYSVGNGAINSPLIIISDSSNHAICFATSGFSSNVRLDLSNSALTFEFPNSVDFGATGRFITRGSGGTAVFGIPAYDMASQFTATIQSASLRGITVQGATSQTGVIFQLQGQSSTTAGREQVDIDTAWATSTDASRKARGIFRAWDTAARECIRIEASGTAAMVGFLGASAQLQQTSGANLTNNVTSGGTTDTVDTWTNLTTYSTDAAAIRNAVFQIARKLKQVNDALRLYGLLT